MKKSILVCFLVALSMGFSLGCAESKPNKRVRIGNTSISPKTQPPATEEPKVNEPAPPPADEQPGDETPGFEDAKAQEIVDKFIANKVNGESVDLESLAKNLKLDLEEISIMFRVVAQNENESSFLTLATYKVEREESTNALSLNQIESKSVGSVANTTLHSLPTAIHTEFDQDGKINSDSEKLSLIGAAITNNALTLRIGQSAQGSQLESLFDIFGLPEELHEGSGQELKLSQTGAYISTDTIRSSENQVGVLIEAFINDHKVQTFYLKFKSQKTETE